MIGVLASPLPCHLVHLFTSRDRFVAGDGQVPPADPAPSTASTLHGTTSICSDTPYNVYCCRPSRVYLTVLFHELAS